MWGKKIESVLEQVVHVGKDDSIRKRNTEIHAKMWIHVLSDAQHYRGKDAEWRKSIKKKKGEKKGRKAVEKKKGLRLDRWLPCKGDEMLRSDAWPARATRHCRQLLAQLPPRLEQSRPIRLCVT